MEDQQEATDYGFIRDATNGAIASIKFVFDDIPDEKEKLYLYNALKSLYSAREWAYRAQVRASHG